MRLKRRKLVSDYIRVSEITEAGRSHIHMIFRGSYIEQKYLSYLWSNIHQSPVVDIRKIRGKKKDKKRVASYLAKYMTKELYKRYSWSWGWVYKGFVKVWKQALQQLNDFQWFRDSPDSFFRFLHLWQDHLHGRTSPAAFLAYLSLESTLARRLAQAKVAP